MRERLELLAQIAELDEAALDDAGPRARRLREDAGARRRPICARTGRSIATTPRASAGAISRTCWGRGSASPPTAEVPELEFRRAELRASHLDDVGGALDLLEQIVKAAPNHEGARRLLEKLVAMPEQRQRVAKILEPVYEAERRLGAPGGDPRRRARGAGGAATAAALLARIADLQENKLQARGAALATWRQVLAADPGNPDALAEIERLGTALERFSELVDVYQELAFKQDAVRHRGARRPAVAGGQAVRRAPRQPARGDRRLEAGPRPRSRGPRHDGAGRGRAGGAVHRDRRRRRPGEDPAACRCGWAPSAADAQEDPVPHRRAAGEVAGRRRRRGGDAALDPGDRSAGARRRSTRWIGSSRRARSTASASR